MPENDPRPVWQQFLQHGVTPSLIVIGAAYAIWAAAPWLAGQLSRVIDRHIEYIDTEVETHKAQCKVIEKLQESHDSTRVAVESISETVKTQAENGAISAEANTGIKNVLEKVTTQQSKDAELIIEIHRNTKKP